MDRCVFSIPFFKMKHPLFIYWQFHSCEQCALIITPSFPLPLPHVPPTYLLPTSCLLLFASVTHPNRLELPARMLTDLGGLILAGNHGYSEFMGAVVLSGPEDRIPHHPSQPPALPFFLPPLPRCSLSFGLGTQKSHLGLSTQ